MQTCGFYEKSLFLEDATILSACIAQLPSRSVQNTCTTSSILRFARPSIKGKGSCERRRKLWAVLFCGMLCLIGTFCPCRPNWVRSSDLIEKENPIHSADIERFPWFERTSPKFRRSRHRFVASRRLAGTERRNHFFRFNVKSNAEKFHPRRAIETIFFFSSTLFFWKNSVEEHCSTKLALAPKSWMMHVFLNFITYCNCVFYCAVQVLFQ